MIKKCILILSLLSSAVLYADNEYTIKEFIIDLEESNYLLGISEADLNIARESAKEQMKNKYPMVSLGLGGSLGARLDSNYSTTDALTGQNINASVKINQLLPTGGTLSVGAGNNTQFGQLGSGEYVWQYPEINAALTQPLFVNNKLIDFDLYKYRFKAVQQSIMLQESQHVIDRNAAVYDGVSVFFREIFLRKQITQIKEYIALNEKRVNADRIMFEQGRLSYSDLQESELELEDLEKSLMETEYSRLVNYNNLLMKIGSDNQKELVPVFEEFKELIIEDEDKMLDMLMSENRDVLISEYLLDNQKNEAIQSGLQSATILHLDFYLKPRYEYGALPENIADSIDDLFGDNAGVDWRLGMSVSIPLDEISKGKNRRKAEEEKIKKAELNLQNTSQNVINSFVQLFENRKFLKKKIYLISENIEIGKNRLAKTEQLYELETVTKLDLEEVEIELHKKRNELWEAQSLLYLNDLTILSLCGEDLQKIISL